jgi:hypothetical protein
MALEMGDNGLALASQRDWGGRPLIKKKSGTEKGDETRTPIDAVPNSGTYESKIPCREG